MAKAPCPAAARGNLYDQITTRIIAELEAGIVPWVRPWSVSRAAAPPALPRNAATDRSYSGINILILWAAVAARDFAGQTWLTFNQALNLGGHVRKGETGTTVVYADRFVPNDERRRAGEHGDEPYTIPFLKRFTVFNVEQCEGLPAELVGERPALPADLILPQVDALIRNAGADLRIGGDQAYYAPAHDFIQVPHPSSFAEPINWHRTALHELGHWSGAPTRLARDMSGTFGTASYAREELIAEMCAAFCCASLGIEPTVRHADYLGHWLAVLREDDRAIVRAASAASKAADYLLAFGQASEIGDAEQAGGGGEAALARVTGRETGREAPGGSSPETEHEPFQDQDPA